jgi:hypothetical protein
MANQGVDTLAGSVGTETYDQLGWVIDRLVWAISPALEQRGGDRDTDY